MRNHIYWTLIALLVLTSSAQARNPEMVPAALETCDGVSWSGLTLGKTTAQDIKNQFKTGRSDLPMSQELSQPKGARQKIFALFSDKHEDSPLAALLIRYLGDGPDLSSLNKETGVLERDYYQKGRLEDWKLATFPGKGIVAFELTKFGRQTVPMVLLCPPGGVAAVCRSLRNTVPPVVERNDPFANAPRVMQFGTASVHTDLNGLELKDGERQDVERTMIDTTAGGTMQYVVGAPGSYTTEIQGEFTPDKGGSLSVACTISGLGPYGTLTGTGSSYKTLPSSKDAASAFSGVNSTNYTAALYEALNDASASFQAAMIASGPPPIQVVRVQEWQRLIEDARDPDQTVLVTPSEVPTTALPSARTSVIPLLPIRSPVMPPQSLFTFANGAQTVGTLIGFDGTTYTVSTPKGMRRFKVAGIKSIQALALVPVGATVQR